ncbi:unnamed protein product [Didymodactylos carnosus]|uniref:Cupin type-1 domain-containing protein n=1 Tax=Didymodactylos carnosus TaxID=1234261 RepID=A0A815GPX7_9BILA|nr:unnamed protein product [Didymodactylos carnosus]CAF1341492.1 unnamed protein product [Didymodactylos carnosus]CAF3990159.1 unnamed protein product [Didymodactylos carnosus]CAF4202991.1 unnamed protein product [Didymodactylos carnosus]
MNTLQLFVFLLCLIFKVDGDEVHSAGKDEAHPNLFHLSGVTSNRYDAGTVQGSNEEVWPILKDQFGSVYLITLKPYGVRQPHWHTVAWEMNYVISG